MGAPIRKGVKEMPGKSCDRGAGGAAGASGEVTPAASAGRGTTAAESVPGGAGGAAGAPGGDERLPTARGSGEANPHPLHDPDHPPQGRGAVSDLRLPPRGRERPQRTRTRPNPPTTPHPRPTPLALQVNALQALSRQVFGFRLAMIALAAPSALLNASPGVGVRLVGTAVVVTFMVSYALLRDWERFGPLLLRHPAVLALDTLLGSLLLISAGPETTLAYVSVCTPLLAGILYGWRGAACFASAQALILLLVHTTLASHSDVSVAERLLLPGFCVITGALGSALRSLMLRFAEATEALAETRSRLAATEAVAAERARLAREMHDSVAKSLYGVALAAEALASGADQHVRDQAELIARAARRTAQESRALLTDLRDENAEDMDLLDELALRARDFTTRTGLPTTYRVTGDHTTAPLPPTVARELLTITAEALDNAHRHADATRVEVSAGIHAGVLRVTVHDDGKGLPPGTTLDALRGAGRFGLLGMTERAAALGARLAVGPGHQGAEMRLELELPPHADEFGQGAA